MDYLFDRLAILKVCAISNCYFFGILARRFVRGCEEGPVVVMLSLRADHEREDSNKVAPLEASAIF
jgi:hypothetical protein